MQLRYKRGIKENATHFLTAEEGLFTSTWLAGTHCDCPMRFLI